MMQALRILLLCTFSYVGALDIFIDSPVLLLDCRSQDGHPVTESTTTSLITGAPGDPREFFEAARNGDLSFIKAALMQPSSSDLDLNWHDSYGYTALYIAAKEDQPRVVGALLDAGADPDAQNIAGQTPVYIAAGYGHTGPLELLLAHGSDPNKVAHDGISPLMYASEYGQVEAVRMLIQAGAHVDYVNSEDGRTALHWAARRDWADVALLLLQNGADIKKRNNNGNTAADEARGWGHDSVAQLIDNY